MKKLILLRGAMGVGKSTFIKEYGLTPYTLCADDIRLQIQSPILNEDGTYSISQTNNKEVWETLHILLEKRMQRGDFVIVDATHVKSSDMRAYKEKAVKYRYKVYLIDFTEIPIEETLYRNSLREIYKQVPEYAIRKAYEGFENNKVPSFIEVVSYRDADKAIKLSPLDFSHYKKIHHIGDIHGCNTVLKEYLKDGLKEDELYIFTGDFIDRGIENAEVLNYIIKIMNKPNVILLEGNHEIYINMYGNGEKAYSKVFEKETKPQLEGKVDKKDLRRLYRKLINVVYYTYNEKTVLVTHGGLSLVPENINLISSEQLIKGIGGYDTDIDKIFTENNINNNFYQVHGHRNYKGTVFGKHSKSFSLEGCVEFGGNLRILTLTKDGFDFVSIKNNIFKLPEHLEIETNVESLIKSLRESRDISEKKFGNISSFNFKRDVFYNNSWNFKSIKARGMFINTITKEIVARGYEKFFNINERTETELDNLKVNLNWPVKAYIKENGYLGLVGYDKESNDFIFASKSSLKSDNAAWLKDLFSTIIDTEEKKLRLLNKLKDYEYSLVFEVIDPENDPHIIKYNEKRLVLLDVIKRTSKFEKLEYNELIEFSKEFGFKYKALETTINNFEEFESWYREVLKEDYKYNDEYIEGFVLEDSKGFIFKVKITYYNRWKYLRTLKDNLSKINLNTIEDEESKEFLNWILTLTEDELSKDIIFLRDKWQNL